MTSVTNCRLAKQWIDLVASMKSYPKKLRLPDIERAQAIIWEMNTLHAIFTSHGVPIHSLTDPDRELAFNLRLSLFIADQLIDAEQIGAGKAAIQIIKETEGDYIPCYKGEHIEVRRIKKRDNTYCWGVQRPGNKKSVLECFHSPKFANLVALYIDTHGGSYERENRNEAKRHAYEVLSLELYYAYFPDHRAPYNPLKLSEQRASFDVDPVPGVDPSQAQSIDIRVRHKRNLNVPWSEIDFVIYTGIDHPTWPDIFCKILANNFYGCVEIRWNWTGSLQGHYVKPTGAPLLQVSEEPKPYGKERPKITNRFASGTMAHAHSYTKVIESSLEDRIIAICLEVKDIHDLLSDYDVPIIGQYGELSLIDRVKWALRFL